MSPGTFRAEDGTGVVVEKAGGVASAATRIFKCRFAAEKPGKVVTMLKYLQARHLTPDTNSSFIVPP
jgi:hypothetical protein